VSGATGVDKPGHIADVAVSGNFAYLAARRLNTTPCGVGGFYVVDISDPTNPTEAGFTAFPPDTYPGEGMQVIGLHTPKFRGDVLVTNNENCGTTPGFVGGFSLYDVTDPLNPTPLSLGNGDTDAGAPAITMHSAFAWQAGRRAFVIGVDNAESGVDDTEIWEITDPTSPVRRAEVGLVDWPDAHTPLANGETVFLHDLVVKKIRGHYFALLSYWDAGWIVLNVDSPANPLFVNDSNYPDPEPLLGFSPAEGNAHQGEWNRNGRFIVGTDEDFSPTRTTCSIDTGPNAGATGCGEFGWTVPLVTNFPDGLTGDVVFGGSGCVEDVNGNGISDRQEVLDNFTQAQTGADIIVFGRGTCFFSIKVETGELAGYDAVVVGNSHGGSAAGLTPNSFLCGGQGSPVLGIASGVCVGHQAMHQLFNDPPEFTGVDLGPGGDLPALGTAGETFSAVGGLFDGWGTVHLLNGRTLEEVDNYAVAEGIDPAFASGFGALSVHEVATDKFDARLGYLSYYDAGLRVIRFGPNGIQEVGHYVDTNGNDFWGVEAHTLPNDPTGQVLILGSDRDSGLWIFDYTGP
jgi:hypothetical protein